jgi:UDP-glucose 4-epimerase
LRGYLRNWLDKVTWIQADIRDINVLNKVLSNLHIQNIVHAAAFTNSKDEQGPDYDKHLVDINITGALNVLDLGIRLSVKRFLFVSSGAVYGGLAVGTDELIGEDAILSPNSLYGISKYAIEMICSRYSSLYGIQAVSVRLGTVYGPMERETRHRSKMSLIHQWVGKAIRREPIDFNEYSVGQDLVYVVDIGQAIRFLLDESYLNYDIYNIGSGKISSRTELYSVMCNALPNNKVNFVGIDEGSFEIKENNPSRSTRMDISRLLCQGYTPQFDIELGLKDYLFWRKKSEFFK